MDCYSCDRAATNACKRCARPYCEDHGNATYCAACLQPASALPSFNLYRAALLVMLVGTAVAVFLLVRPPGDTGGAAPVLVGKSVPTPSPTSEAPATSTAPVDNPPQSSGTETTTPVATATGAPAGSPTTTPTESAFNSYVIVDGDTLFDIAQRNLAPGDDIVAFARAIAALNGIDYDNPVLTVGKSILLPKPPD